MVHFTKNTPLIEKKNEKKKKIHREKLKMSGYLKKCASLNMTANIFSISKNILLIYTSHSH